MKLLSVSFLLILISCAFLLSRVNAAEKLPNEKPSSQSKQTSDPDTKTASPNSQTPPPETKSRSSVHQPSPNQGKADSTPPTKETGYFDFLWASQIPNWISILGWIIAIVITVASLGLVARQADIAKQSVDALRQQGSSKLAIFDLHLDALKGSKDACVIIQFRNVGQGNGFLLGSSFNVLTGKELPRVPSYKEFHRPIRGVFTLPQDTPTPPIRLDLPKHAGSLEALKILGDSGIHLFVYGVFEYGDIFNRTHSLGFAYQHDGGESKHFFIVGGTEYNYDRIKETA